MPFKGMLKRNIPAQIVVSAGASNQGLTGSTLQKVVRIPLLQKSEVFELDLLTIAPSTSAQVITTFGNNITRIEIAVHPPPGGSAVLKVQQGVILDENIVNDDATFVYDVVP